jgi:hypothetical protein
MEEIETVAALTDNQDRTPREERREEMGAAEAEDEGGEERGQQAAVHEKIRCSQDDGVEEQADGGEADGGKGEALPGCDLQGELELAEGDASEEGAGVGEWSVLEEAEELGGTVTVDRADDVVGVQQEIERVRDESDDPEAKKHEDQVNGLPGPRGADEEGEGGVEDHLAGEGPGDGVPEGGEGRTPTLENEWREDEALPELEVGAGLPLALQHVEGEDEDEKIDGIESGEAGEPEVALDEGRGAVGVIVSEDVAGDEEEDADEDVAIVDDGIEETEMRRREVKEDDG